MFGMNANELFGWEVVDQLIINSKPELLFGERLQLVYDLLSFVRFPLLQHSLLDEVCLLYIKTLRYRVLLHSSSNYTIVITVQLQNSNILRHIPVLQNFVSLLSYSNEYFLFFFFS